MICVISAVMDEVGPLIAATAARPVTNQQWFAKQHNLLIAPVGIGYLEAAIQLQHLLTEQTTIDQVFFTGSAGVYPGCKKVAIGDICISQDTILCDGAAEKGLSDYIPVAVYGPINAEFEKEPSIPAVRVATVMTITTNDTLAIEIARNREAEVENMELFGIARVCGEKSIPWTGILGITNIVGSMGRSQWLQNREQAADLCCNYILHRISPPKK